MQFKLCISLFIFSFLQLTASFAQNFSYPDIHLIATIFGGDTISIKKDGTDEYYVGYHWSHDPLDEHKPVAYVSNKVPMIAATMEWNCDSKPDSVYIKAIGEHHISFPARKVPIINEGGSSIIQYPLTSSSSSFDHETIKYDDSFQVEWFISFDNISWMNIGVSYTELFVLRNQPMIESIDFKYWHTIFYLSCKNANGLSAEVDIIPALFSEFEDQQVVNHNNDTLRYYKNMATSNTTLEKLLLYKDGQCYTYAKLFLAMIKIQGISKSNNYVNITPTYDYYCGNYVNSFIVKNWAPIDMPTSDCPTFPYLNKFIYLYNSTYTAYNFYHTEMQDVDGINGPGNTNPSSYFNNHQITYINDMYYDPCYGTKFNTLAAYKDNSIQAWSYRFEVYDSSLGTNIYRCYFSTDLSNSNFSQTVTTY